MWDVATARQGAKKQSGVRSCDPEVLNLDPNLQRSPASTCRRIATVREKVPKKDLREPLLSEQLGYLDC